MPEPISFNLADAQLADDTIDFYALLNEPQDAPTETLRAKIGAIYSEAQANRDHRNLNKRREYQALLELLPPARTALLEAPKRAKYDDFLAKAKRGEAPGDFESFINDLMGFNEPMEENSGLLGVKEKTTEPRARVIPAPTPTATKPAASSPASFSSSPGASRPPARSSSGGGGNMALVGAIAGFVIGAIIGFVWKGLVPAVLIGIILAAIGFVALNSMGGNKVKM